MAQKKKVEARVKAPVKAVKAKAPATPPVKSAAVKPAKAAAPAVAPKVIAPKVAAVAASKAKPHVAAAPPAAQKTVKKAVLPIKSQPVKSQPIKVQHIKAQHIKVEAKAAAHAAAQPVLTKRLAVAAGPMKPGAAPILKAATAHVAGRAVPASVQKPVGQKLTAPLAAQPQTPKAIAEKTAAARQVLAVQKKPVNQRHGFKANEFIVYPAHGVGRITGIEEQEIAGMSLELFVITFEKEKLTLRVPTGKLASVGMRKLADDAIVKRSMETLKGRARIKRTMWSRRAQEYVAKINSGDLISIAEVVRDLYRSEAQPEQSYSERQLYEDALDRMAREIAAVEKLDERGAVQRITEVLSKSAKSRRLASEGEAAAVVEAA